MKLPAQLPIYLDHHATTPVAPHVDAVILEAMDEATVRELAAEVQRILTEASGLKLAAIARALWNINGDDERSDELSPTAESRAGGDSEGALL